MSENLYYTDWCNLYPWSDSMHAVAYDERDGVLYVIWQSNQDRAYAYYALRPAFEKIRDEVAEVYSVRGLVQAVTHNLQKKDVYLDATLFEREKDEAPVVDTAVTTSNSYKVTVKVSATLEVDVSAEGIAAAAQQVLDLFNKNVVEGDVEVTEVKKA